MRKFLTITAAIAALGILSAEAIPAKRANFTVKQSDGTQLTLRVVGDEFSHRTITDDGYTVVQGFDGDWYYAKPDNGKLVASETKVKSSLENASDISAATLSRGLKSTRVSEKKISTIALRKAQATRAAGFTPGISKVTAKTFGSWGGKISGTSKTLVLLVNFKDISFTTATPHVAFSDMLNKEGYSENSGTGSARDYFIDNSSGVFQPEFDVYGPYTVSQTSAYYAGDSGTANSQKLVSEACQLADNDVNFADYVGKDGTVSVYVYFAGYNQAEGGGDNTIWPHQYWLFGNSSLTLDGVKIYSFVVTSEFKGGSGSQMAGIGTFCHEFGHSIGLPDFYDTDYDDNGNSFGLATVSVMDYGSYLNGGRTPPAYTILERWMLGWGEPTVITAAGDYILAPVYGNNGYLIYTSDNDEFFLFENRSKNVGNKWDYYLLNGDGKVSAGGGGMLVYHIDYTSKYRSRWDSNDINSYSNHECVRLVRANEGNASQGQYYNYSKYWYFPGSGNVSALTDVTNPALLDWNGKKTDYRITKISLSGNDVALEINTSDFDIDARQYDALIKWGSQAYSSWVVTLKDNSDSSTQSFETTTNAMVLNSLKPSTTYTVSLKGKNGSTVSGAIFTYDFTTLEANSYPMSALQIGATQPASEYIRLSVKNLDCTPKQIQWYVDDALQSSAYVKLSAGRHTIKAAITDTNNNIEYLFRYITVE